MTQAALLLPISRRGRRAISTGCVRCWPTTSCSTARWPHLDNADDCVAGLERMSKIMEKLDVKKRFVDGDDVITWFDLHTSVADPVPTANWSHVEGGRITAIKVAFDARGLAPPGSR